MRGCCSRTSPAPLVPVEVWHTLDVEKTALHLSTDRERGLSSEEAAARLAADGPNELKGGPRLPWLHVLLAQLVDPMNWIFLALGIVCYVLKDYLTGTVLIALALLNVYLSFSQEYAAAQTLASLQSLSVPRATVLRDGVECVVPSKSVVVGDVLVLKDGDAVTADARVVSSHRLATNEAILTGEANPVAKHCDAIASRGASPFCPLPC